MNNLLMRTLPSILSSGIVIFAIWYSGVFPVLSISAFALTAASAGIAYGIVRFIHPSKTPTITEQPKLQPKPQAQPQDLKDILDDTRKLGSETLDKLQSQHKQLVKTEDNLDVEKYEVEVGKREIRTVKSLFGALVNALTPSWFKPAPPGNGHVAEFEKEVEIKGKAISAKPKDKTPPQKAPIDPIDAKSKALLPDYARKMAEEDERTFHAIKDAAPDLKRLARAMNDEVDEQNKLLDQTNKDAQTTSTKLKRTIKKARTVDA